MANETKEKTLRLMEHAFWDLVDILADNLPDYADDEEGEEYIKECEERFEADKEEFKEAFNIMAGKAANIK